MRHAKIIIELLGTEGLLDRPERIYAVEHLQDQAENAKREIMEILKENPGYKHFGWTMISAHKIMPKEEMEELLGDRKNIEVICDRCHKPYITAEDSVDSKCPRCYEQGC